MNTRVLHKRVGHRASPTSQQVKTLPQLLHTIRQSNVVLLSESKQVITRPTPRVQKHTLRLRLAI